MTLILFSNFFFVLVCNKYDYVKFNLCMWNVQIVLTVDRDISD